MIIVCHFSLSYNTKTGITGYSEFYIYNYDFSFCCNTKNISPGTMIIKADTSKAV